MKPATDFEDLVTNVTALAESLRGIQELGVAQYTPIVEIRHHRPTGILPP